MKLLHIPDVQNQPDERKIPIDKVGVKGLRYPISVKDRSKQLQHTVGTFDLFVNLPHDFKGTHMSRFIEVLNEFRGEISMQKFQHILEKIKNKIKGNELEKRIEVHKCGSNSIGINEKVDFILCFYMIHEVPDQDKLFDELKSILKPIGKLYIIEPKFHVSKKSFEGMIDRIKDIGFEIIDRPKVFFSRTVLFQLI